MNLQKVIQLSAAENVDFAAFINSALNDQLSWEVLGVFLDNLTPTLSKSKDLNKILLQQLKQLNIQLKSKVVEEEDPFAQIWVNDENVTINDTFDKETDSKTMLQKTLKKELFFDEMDRDENEVDYDLANEYFEEFQPLDQAPGSNVAKKGNHDPMKMVIKPDIDALKMSEVKPNSDGQFVCKTCGKIYKFKKSFMGHLKAHKISDQMEQLIANQANRNVFECLICLKSFDIRRAMEFHSKVHDPSQKCFKCTLCGKLLRVNRLLDHDEAHKNYVENEDVKKKPFKCPDCPKRFSCYANRLQHRKIHDPNRESYACKVCSKTFVSQMGFKNHEEKVCKIVQ